MSGGHNKRVKRNIPPGLHMGSVLTYPSHDEPMSPDYPHSCAWPEGHKPRTPDLPAHNECDAETDVDSEDKTDVDSEDETEEQEPVRLYVGANATNATVVPVVGHDVTFMRILTEVGPCGVDTASLGVPHLCLSATAFGTHVLSAVQVGLNEFRVTTKVGPCDGYYHLTEPVFSGLVTTHGMQALSTVINRDPSCLHHETFVAYIKFALSAVTYLDFVKLIFMVLKSTTDLPVKYVDQEDTFLTCLTRAARTTKCTLQERAEMTKKFAEMTSTSYFPRAVRAYIDKVGHALVGHQMWESCSVARERYLAVKDRLAK